MNLAAGYGLSVGAALLTAAGQICFKKVAVTNSSYFQKFFQPLFCLGIVLFVCPPLLLSLAARVMEYSVLYAMTALNYVFILMLSRCFLGERIDWPKIVGVCVIILGLVVMMAV